MRRTAIGLATELEHRVGQLIKDYNRGTAEGKTSWPDRKAIGEPFAKWFLETFRVGVSNTPKGGKAAVEMALRFLWAAQNSVAQNNNTSMIESDWEKLRPLVPTLVSAFTSEGSAQILTELKTSIATYLNLKGLAAKTFQSYVQNLDALFSSVRGWRAKALTGGLTVALAGPDKFRGTAGGKYNAPSDTMFVRVTPDVLKRSGGKYASLEYILVHELGHRYDVKVRTSIDFDRPEWYTTRYSTTQSMSGSEAFAELFALGHFGITSEGSRQFGDKLEAFEQIMQRGGRMAGKAAAAGGLAPLIQKLGSEVVQDIRSKP